MMLLRYCTVSAALIEIAFAVLCRDSHDDKDEVRLLQVSASVHLGGNPKEFTPSQTPGAQIAPSSALRKADTLAAPLDPMTIPGLTAAVPKIIHFMYKVDLGHAHAQWPNPIWNVSFEAWKEHFPEPEYKYHFWTDSLVDELFKAQCPEHYGKFAQFQNEIFRADLGRYCILKFMGGMYSDLDYEPRTNFYSDLKPGKVSLIESPYENEMFQNSLMASPAGSTFSAYWTSVLDAFANQRSLSQSQSASPDKLTGPHLLDVFIQSLEGKASTLVNTLPCKDFQRKVHQDAGKLKEECGYLTSNDSVKGIHWGTVSWIEGNGNLSPELAGKVNHQGTVELFRLIHPEIAI